MNLEQLQEKYPTSCVVELTENGFVKCIEEVGGSGYTPKAELETQFLVVGHYDVNGDSVLDADLTLLSDKIRKVNVKDGMLGVIVWHEYGTFAVSRSWIKKVVSK